MVIIKYNFFMVIIKYSLPQLVSMSVEDLNIIYCSY